MAKTTHAIKRRRTKSKTGASVVSRKKPAADLDQVKKATEKLIDAFMRKIGDSNPSERTDEEGWRWFEYRSARGRAGVVQSASDGMLYLRAESLVGELPSDITQALQFTRELLETNMTIPGAARLGIGGEGVFVCGTIPAVGLTGDVVQAHIHSILAMAASFMNPFAGQVKYEGPDREDVPAEPLKDEGASQGDVASDPIQDPNPPAV